MVWIAGFGTIFSTSGRAEGGIIRSRDNAAQTYNRMENGSNSGKGATIWVIVAIVAIIAVLGVVLIGQKGSDRAQTGDESNQVAGGTVPEGSNPAGITEEGSGSGIGVGAGAAADVGVDMLGVQEFKVEGGMMYFNPKEIRVKKGDKVRIVFTNKEGFHDWVIDEFNARTPQIRAGETATIEFVADKVGTFEYYCSVGQHRQLGMKGNLIVEEL